MNTPIIHLELLEIWRRLKLIEPTIKYLTIDNNWNYQSSILDTGITKNNVANIFLSSNSDKSIKNFQTSEVVEGSRLVLARTDDSSQELTITRSDSIEVGNEDDIILTKYSAAEFIFISQKWRLLSYRKNNYIVNNY